MSDQDYQHMRALIEHDQVDWTGDGVLCQLVTVIMLDDLGHAEQAVCTLTVAQARELGFQLLTLAEHANQLSRHREDDR